MKKIIILLSALCLMLCSCSKDESKTYTIDVVLTLSSSASIDMAVREYSASNDIVGSHKETIKSSGHHSYPYTASKNAEKLTIQFGNSTYSFYVAKVYYLNEVDVIYINDETLTQKSEPLGN